MDETDQLHSAAALLEGLVKKLEAFLTEIISTSINSLSSIDLFDKKALASLESLSSHLSEASSVVFKEADAFVTSQDKISSINISSLNDKTTFMASSLTKLSTFLRAQGSDKNDFNWLSPESLDAWISVVEAASERSQTLGGEDLNFVARGKKIEEYLSTAVENDTKLTEAEEKIKTLENSITTKSKEIFRPALRDALSDASVWKAKTLSDKVSQLPPLSDMSSTFRKDLTNNSRQLNLAFSEVRLAKASIGLVKLDRNATGFYSQSLLDNERAKVASAMNRLESIESRTNLAMQAITC
ncbi:hypothetical protein CTEN210_18039 [Chaetoceros tenuissimus]|uniref:Uncharacterized protein n=1 Tax=Chaetoceros tenuissimus TaxID=426638 RepID=A0AAD3HFY1_9STRA|nr:hypothetical protein CTEN210_18039 [Chaetoceros tenuissimus]